MTMLEIFLFYFFPPGMVLWIIAALYHLRRRHQIREKSTAFYYALLLQDGIGAVADIAANYSWFSLLIWNRPARPWTRDEGGKLKWYTKELTMSQHMKRLNEAWVEIEDPTLGDRWSHWFSSKICRQLNKMERPGKIHC